MKKPYTVTIFLLILILTSFSKDHDRHKINDEGIDFIIRGTALNGEGKKLALYIPSLGMENRLTSEIRFGKFYFKGRLKNIERAQLAFEEELEVQDGAYASYDVFLTQDTVSVSFIVDENKSFNSLYFAEASFKDKGVNSYYHATKNQFNNLLYHSDTENSRELRTNIIVKNIELFSRKEHTVIGLFNLRQMFEYIPLFQINEITASQKKNLNDYFESIDKNLSSTPDYIVVESYINLMNNNGYTNKFKDFSLVDKDGFDVLLSEIISENSLTVVDFWWSGCKPCRNFNKESKAYYKSLKKNGIEIVSINVDKGLKRWKNASNADQIEWIDLYAGANSKIQIDYNIIAFPTTLIFDNDQQVVDFKFKKVSELLKLK